MPSIDWDEPRHMPKGVTTGEPLDRIGIAELEARIAAFEQEIARTRAEIERKRNQAAAADAIFKS